MGKVFKDIAVSYRGGKPQHAEAQVDTGADATLLCKSLADKLEVEILDREAFCAQSFDGRDVFGYRIPVDLDVDGRVEPVVAFVPVYTLNDKQKPRTINVTHNLIGSDFLQRAGANLSLANPHELTFSPRQSINFLRAAPLSPKMRKFLEEHAAEAFALPKEERHRRASGVDKLARQVHSLLKKK